jgi:alcohol dehydrogenase
MVTGHGARDHERLAYAREFGADHALDVATEDPIAALREATGGLADVVVDVTAKAPGAPGQAVRLARAGATVVLAGTRGRVDTPGFDPDVIVAKELRILGALGVDAVAYRQALDLLAAGVYPFETLPCRTVGFAGAGALLRDMAGEGDPPPVRGVIVPDVEEQR